MASRPSIHNPNTRWTAASGASVNTGLPSPLESPANDWPVSGAKSRRAALLATSDLDMSNMDVDLPAGNNARPPPSNTGPGGVPAVPADSGDAAEPGASGRSTPASARPTMSAFRPPPDSNTAGPGTAGLQDPLRDKTTFFELMGEHDVALCAILLQQQEIKDLKRKRDRVKRDLDRFGGFFAEEGGKEEALGLLSSLDAKVAKLEMYHERTKATPWRVNKLIDEMLNAHGLSLPGGAATAVQPQNGTGPDTRAAYPGEGLGSRSSVDRSRMQNEGNRDSTRSDAGRANVVRREFACVNDLKDMEEKVRKVSEDVNQLKTNMQELQSSTKEAIGTLKNDVSHVEQTVKQSGSRGKTSTDVLSKDQTRDLVDEIVALSHKRLEASLATQKSELTNRIQSAVTGTATENEKLVEGNRREFEQALSDFSAKFTSMVDEINANLANVTKDIKSRKAIAGEKTGSWAPGSGSNPILSALAAKEGDSHNGDYNIALRSLADRLRHVDVVLDGFRQRIDNATSEAQVRRMIEVLVAQVPSLGQLMTTRDEARALYEQLMKDAKRHEDLAGQHAARIDSLEKEFHAFKIEASSTEHKAFDNAERLEHLEEGQRNLSALVTNTREELDEIQGRQNADSSRLANVDSKFTEFEDAFQTLNRDLIRLDTQIRILVDKFKEWSASDKAKTGVPSDANNGRSNQPLPGGQPSRQPPVSNTSNGHSSRANQDDEMMQDTIVTTSRLPFDRTRKSTNSTGLGSSLFKGARSTKMSSKRPRLVESDED